MKRKNVKYRRSNMIVLSLDNRPKLIILRNV